MNCLRFLLRSHMLIHQGSSSQQSGNRRRNQHTIKTKISQFHGIPRDVPWLGEATHSRLKIKLSRQKPEKGSVRRGRNVLPAAKEFSRKIPDEWSELTAASRERQENFSHNTITAPPATPHPPGSSPHASRASVSHRSRASRSAHADSAPRPCPAPRQSAAGTRPRAAAPHRLDW